ncbi:MAG TPA: MFS transporter [Acidobacteriaceae bacterium]|nr:MFS transporter [Acidobacteriaceae bacterium]
MRPPGFGPPPLPTSDRRLISIVWLHIAFAATGFGTTLLGCLLPTLHFAWNLTDAEAGFLFACQFTGASLGALLVRKDLFRSIQQGYFVMVASALILGALHGHAAAAAFFVFGLGMGWAMTAINMVGGTAFERSGAALSLLNASWIVGAALSPGIATRWIRYWRPMHIYFVVAVGFAAIALSLRHYRANLLGDRSRLLRVSEGATPWVLIAGFSLLGFLYVGVEVSVSGWMMTFVHRLAIGGGLWAAVITSCFWLALLCGRLLAPAILLRVSETRLLLAAMVVACCSVVSILLNHSPVAILLSAVSAGLALAPIFPLCASRVLALTHESPQTKWLFCVAGMGGSVLPWMTGRLSTHTGSLRDGLLVPVFALGTMIVCFLLIARSWHAGSVSTRETLPAAE